MKNIVIIGPARSGKSTLASMIVKEIPIYSVINGDVLREGIYEGFFKEIDKKESELIVEKAFPQIINRMVEQYSNHYNPNLYYIIEGDILSIEEALKIKQKYDVEIVCIGMPIIQPRDLFARIRHYSSKYGCWTDKLTDEGLLEKRQQFIKRSKKDLKLAEENNITYLDTSLNMDCIKKYVVNLKNNMNE